MQEQRTDKKRAVRRKPRVDFDDFEFWLGGLGAPAVPKLHVNGPTYTTAVVTVDFGTPLAEYKLTAEDTAELIARMRKAVRDLCGDGSPRISNDSANGVWWASLG